MISQSIPADKICFTDNPDIVSNGWIIDTTPYHITHPSTVDNNQYINSLCNNKHTFNIAKYYKQSFQHIPRLRQYDVIVWMDGSVEIIHPHTSSYILNNTYKHKIITCQHEYRHGILEKEVIASNFERYTSTHWNGQDQPFQNIENQYAAYLRNGYSESYFKTINPREHFGVWLTCIIAFLNTDAAVSNFLNVWYLQTLQYTTQDQIGFPYTCQVTGLIPYTLPDDTITGENPHVCSSIHIKHEHGR